MNKVISIDQELAKLDEQLNELYKKKDELNKELRLIQKENLKHEVERWKLEPGKFYWLFSKYNDPVYSTLYGYHITSVRDDDFFTMVQTKYSIETGEPQLQINNVLMSTHALRTNREESNIYVVGELPYRDLQARLSLLDTVDVQTLQSIETEVVKPVALSQVE